MFRRPAVTVPVLAVSVADTRGFSAVASRPGEALAGYSQLTQLYPTGLEAPLQQCLPRTGLAGLRHLHLRSCRGVTDETLASLPDLAPALKGLRIAGEQRQHAQAIDIRTQGGNDEHTHSNAK